MTTDSTTLSLRRQRVRHLLPNLHLGHFPPAPLNAITDVPGVLVSTLSIHDDGVHEHIRSPSSPVTASTRTSTASPTPSGINTGVTTILPRLSWFDSACYAAIHSFNGSGELTGSHWINETGLLNSPVVLTNSLSVGAGYEGIYRWSVGKWQRKQDEGGAGEENRKRWKPIDWFLLPVVGETYDGFLNDIGRMVVRGEDVVRGIELAARSGGDESVESEPDDDDDLGKKPSQWKRKRKGQPVAEGNTGGGTGMLTMGFKAGTGTASRIVPGIVRGEKTEWVVGGLVQSNFGKLEDLHFGSIPVGRMWKKEFGTDGLIVAGDESEDSSDTSPPPQAAKEGSIIVILATNVPLSPTQLSRLAKRATVGLARAGGFGPNSSGDIFLAFSTAASIPREPRTDPGMSVWEARRAARVEKEQEVEVVQDTTINGLFEAAAEVVHESILNALCMAEDMVGVQGNKAGAIPLDWLKGVVERYEAAGLA